MTLTTVSRPLVAIRGIVHTTIVLLRMVRFEHTIFALPFALFSAVLAVESLGMNQSWPDTRTLGWILLAMFGARSSAMAVNRILDAGYDAANPRTRERAIPAGAISISRAWTFAVATGLLLLIAAAQLNPLCLLLSPMAIVALVGYSWTKRFTRWTHLVLGGAIGIAPVGAWIAITGSVAWLPIMIGAATALWIAGFDIIYALQDIAVDRQLGIRSLPADLGARRALRIARRFHVLMLGLLGLVGLVAALGLVYYIGLIACAVALAYEHAIVTPHDFRRVNTAFFTVNGWVGVGLFACLALDRWIGGWIP